MRRRRAGAGRWMHRRRAGAGRWMHHDARGPSQSANEPVYVVEKRQKKY
jgi:hypothetical protein